MSQSFRPTIYAIDFGTSNSLLGASDGRTTHGPVALDAKAPDPTVLRTLLYFPDAERCFVGSEAIAEYVANELEGRLLRSVKRFLPRKEFVGTFIEDRPMNLEHLVAVFLGEMRRRANDYFQTDVRRVVLGRPARFDRDDSRDRYAEYRLERSARLAGFTEVHFCPEPVAAAREFLGELNEPKTILVADFGGGTSDFCVLRMDREGFRDTDVIALGGVALAGDSLESDLMRRRLSQHFGADAEYQSPLGSNIMPMPPRFMEAICTPGGMAMLSSRDVQTFLTNVRQWSVRAEDQTRIDKLLCLVSDQLGFSVFEAIEATKRQLSSQEQATFIFDHPAMHIEDVVTRVEFEQYTARTVETIVQTMDATVADAGIGYESIDLVCCTGGTSQVRAIDQAIRQRVGADRIRHYKMFHSVVSGLTDRAKAIAS